MSFQNQFSLSVELTKIIPIAGLATAAASGALLKLARDLTAEGSDIVIEEDLAAVFRQNRIDSEFQNAFCKDVATASKVSTLTKWFPILLHSGPGTTVGRALRDPAYVPLVVQISLLCAFHDVEALAEGLEEALRLRSQDLSTTSVPSSSALKGTIQAIADQTVGFNWTALIEKTRIAICLSEHQDYIPVSGHARASDRCSSLPICLLQACLDMLAAVQRLYKDSIMKIETADGYIVIIVWAHYVLGLTVHVTNTRVGTVEFGTGEPSVIIEIPTLAERSIPTAYLLNSLGEILLRVEPEESDLPVKIAGEPKVPAVGYASNVLHSEAATSRPVLITDLCHYTAALAFVFSGRLYAGEQGATAIGNINQRVFFAGSRSIERAAALLLGPNQYDKVQIDIFYKYLLNKSLDEMGPPASFSGDSEDLQLQIFHHDWRRLRAIITSLAFVILAFAAVGDLDQCENMYLGSFDHALPYPPQAQAAKSPIMVDYNHWYRVIARLLVGRSRLTEIDDSSLISGWGWSIFYDTFVECGPQLTVPGKVWIQRGIPYSDGRVAHRIVDGVDTVNSNATPMQKVGEAGENVKAGCSIRITQNRFLIAHRSDTFVVSKKYQAEGSKNLIAAGYLALAGACWGIPVIEQCLKKCCKASPTFSGGKEEGSLVLNIGTAAVTGCLFWSRGRDGRSSGMVGFISARPINERVVITLTAGNSHAQWLVLVGVANMNKASRDKTLGFGIPSLRMPILRRQNVCVSCFVAQASQYEGNLVLIL